MAIIYPRLFARSVFASSLGFRVNGTNSKTLGTTFDHPETIASALQTQVASTVTGAVVTFDSEWRLKIAAPATFGVLNPSSGLNALTLLLGFTQSASINSTLNAAVYGSGTPNGMTAALPITGIWAPGVPPQSDSVLEEQRPNSTTSRSIAGYTMRIDESSLRNRRWKWAFIPYVRTFQAADAAAGLRSLEEFMRTTSQFRYYENALTPGTYSEWVLSHDTATEFSPERQYVNTGLYSHPMVAWRKV